MDKAKIIEDAVALRDSGYNCAQAVLCALRDYTNLDDKTALAIAGAFGGGVGSGEICGTIVGGLMAVGIKNPYIDNTRPEDKKTIRNLATGFCRTYNEKYGCCRCKDLKLNGIDCGELVAFGAETAIKIIEENKK